MTPRRLPKPHRSNCRQAACGWTSSRSALRAARGGDKPELLHNAQRIGVDPDLDDLPVRDPNDLGNASDSGLSGGGEGAEVAAQGCADGATAQAAVRGPEVVLDGEADIRHRLENRREEGLDLV